MKSFSFQSNTLKAALTGLAGAAAVFAVPSQVQAANPITVVTPVAYAGTYTIQYVEGAWTDPAIQAQLTTTPWWGNSALAAQLSAVLMNSTGTGTPAVPTITLPQSILNNGTTPPVAAWYLFATNTASVFGNNVVQGYFTSPPAYSMAVPLNILQSATPYTWAIGTFTPPPNQPVPGPLPLLGAASAFGFSRRLRSRINKSATA